MLLSFFIFTISVFALIFQVIPFPVWITSCSCADWQILLSFVQLQVVSHVGDLWLVRMSILIRCVLSVKNRICDHNNKYCVCSLWGKDSNKDIVSLSLNRRKEQERYNLGRPRKFLVPFRSLGSMIRCLVL